MKYTIGTTADPEFAIPIKEAEDRTNAERGKVGEKSDLCQCVLNVTAQEYDSILQMNHDALVWNNRDKKLLHGLELLLGKEVAEQVGQFEECRMAKRRDRASVPRVQAV